MGRNKKGAFNALTWRLNNPEKTPSFDDETRFDQFESCGSQREAVSASEVPPDVRATIERSTKITEFVHCPTCKTYSGFSQWSSF